MEDCVARANWKATLRSAILSWSPRQPVAGTAQRPGQASDASAVGLVSAHHTSVSVTPGVGRPWSKPQWCNAATEMQPSDQPPKPRAPGALLGSGDVAETSKL